MLGVLLSELNTKLLIFKVAVSLTEGDFRAVVEVCCLCTACKGNSSE